MRNSAMGNRSLFAAFPGALRFAMRRLLDWQPIEAVYGVAQEHARVTRSDESETGLAILGGLNGHALSLYLQRRRSGL